MSDEFADLRQRVAHLEAQDQRQLDNMPLFHYIVAGLTFLIGCFPMIHVAVGLALVLSPPSGPNPPPPWFGWIFVAIGGAVILFFWSVAALLVVAGRSLAARRRYTLCVVAAALSLLVMPFGTVLGIFTLLLLLKPAVKRSFEGQA